MKWQTIGKGCVTGALASEMLILSFLTANEEHVADLHLMHEQPHTPHTNYPIPDYLGNEQVISSTATASNALQYPSF